MGKLTLGLEDKHCRRASGAVAIEVSSSGPFRGKQPLAKGTAAVRLILVLVPFKMYQVRWNGFVLVLTLIK